jgi:hypothetical protein
MLERGSEVVVGQESWSMGMDIVNTEGVDMILNTAEKNGLIPEILIRSMKRVEPRVIAFAVAHLSKEDMKNVRDAIDAAIGEG